MSDSVSGQTVVDPRGYLTSLDSLHTLSQDQIVDINNARHMYRRLVRSNPTNPQIWISAARLEEQSGIFDEVIKCEVI